MSRKFFGVLANFFLPRKLAASSDQEPGRYVVAIIPTYKPSKETFQLITSLLAAPNHGSICKMRVIVVNDCAPAVVEYQKILAKIEKLAKKSRRLSLIKTPKASFKPGAINYGLAFAKKKKFVGDVIVTTDDDIKINRFTIPRLVDYLFSNQKLGAVTSLVRVSNKNKNLLTRFQGLEYHGFNITKIADNGFFAGPLVMQGMLTAFRQKAINQVRGYDRHNLIEDYEITAKLKKFGWHVGVCQKALAWTAVPENFVHLWKQRVRWSFWGLLVVRDYFKHFPSVIQDVIGHSIFLSLITLVLMSIFSPRGDANLLFIKILIGLAFGQFALAYLFAIMTLNRYKNADWKDHLLRLLILPELLYATVLSLVIFGSYFFFIYHKAFTKLTKKLPRTKTVYQKGLKAFGQIGYSLTWGTR